MSEHHSSNTSNVDVKFVAIAVRLLTALEHQPLSYMRLSGGMIKTAGEVVASHPASAWKCDKVGEVAPCFTIAARSIDGFGHVISPPLQVVASQFERRHFTFELTSFCDNQHSNRILFVQLVALSKICDASFCVLWRTPITVWCLGCAIAEVVLSFKAAVIVHCILLHECNCAREDLPSKSVAAVHTAIRSHHGW